MTFWNYIKSKNLSLFSSQTLSWPSGNLYPNCMPVVPGSYPGHTRGVPQLFYPCRTEFLIKLIAGRILVLPRFYSSHTPAVPKLYPGRTPESRVRAPVFAAQTSLPIPSPPSPSFPSPAISPFPGLSGLGNRTAFDNLYQRGHWHGSFMHTLILPIIKKRILV